MSLNKDETAVRGCNPPVSVLVVWVSCKVYFSRSTISFAVLFVISFYLLIRSLSRSYELQHYRLRSLAVLVSLLMKKEPFFREREARLRVRFFGRIRKRICDPRSYGFSDTKETQNPKKDYFVMTRQAGGTQYIYQNDISLVLP